MSESVNSRPSYVQYVTVKRKGCIKTYSSKKQSCIPPWCYSYINIVSPNMAPDVRIDDDSRSRTICLPYLSIVEWLSATLAHSWRVLHVWRSSRLPMATLGADVVMCKAFKYLQWKKKRTATCQSVNIVFKKRHTKQYKHGVPNRYGSIH